MQVKGYDHFLSKQELYELKIYSPKQNLGIFLDTLYTYIIQLQIKNQGSRWNKSKRINICRVKPFDECENILCGYLYDGDLVFVILKGIYGFKFSKRFLEISSRDLTSSLLFCQS